MRIPLADPFIPTEPIQNNIQEEVQEIEMSEMCSHQSGSEDSSFLSNSSALNRSSFSNSPQNQITGNLKNDSIFNKMNVTRLYFLMTFM